MLLYSFHQVDTWNGHASWHCGSDLFVRQRYILMEIAHAEKCPGSDHLPDEYIIIGVVRIIQNGLAKDAFITKATAQHYVDQNLGSIQLSDDSFPAANVGLEAPLPLRCGKRLQTMARRGWQNFREES